eukprot:TRINITY_DN10581_c0_g1_i1.p1 TRINITY_DN10581_c0_g1~~TRINITY_DN10581_c0_g1_i1.p1  ORF type:complete len:171 (-),score=8.15 TRINITY_DN10581_c0_g1_i1:169-681(-)
MEARQKPNRKDNLLFWVLLEGSQWIVMVGCAIAILYLRNVEILAFLLGAVLCNTSAKYLKKIIAQPRPVPGLKKSHGMPSSHAQSMGFFASALTWTILTHAIFPESYKLILVVIINFGFFSMLIVRWMADYHTIPQLLVGFTIGSTFGFLWVWGLMSYLPAITWRESLIS